jgi:hypothetical protein
MLGGMTVCPTKSDKLLDFDTTPGHAPKAEKYDCEILMAVYLLTILTTVAVLFVIPLVLASSCLDYLRRRRSGRAFVVAASIGIGFLTGGYLGWIIRPFEWSLSFSQTLRANYGDHSVEYYAERVLLFVLMTASIGAWITGIGTAVVMKRKRIPGLDT